MVVEDIIESQSFRKPELRASFEFARILSVGAPCGIDRSLPNDDQAIDKLTEIDLDTTTAVVDITLTRFEVKIQSKLWRKIRAFWPGTTRFHLRFQDRGPPERLD